MAKILVVDDEARVREVVSLALYHEGYDVISAEYGLIGYSMAQVEQPDLIILDLMMPVMDGFQVLKKLKSDPSTSRIPVIILTAKMDAASERDCMQRGASDYIKKTWGPQELQERIGIALGFPDLSDVRESRRRERSEVPRSENSERSDTNTPPEPTNYADPDVSSSDNVAPDSTRYDTNLLSRERAPSQDPEKAENRVVVQPTDSPIREALVARGDKGADVPFESERSRYQALLIHYATNRAEPDAENRNLEASTDSGKEFEGSIVVDTEELEESESSSDGRFRTRRFRIREDGIDPASLV